MALFVVRFRLHLHLQHLTRCLAILQSLQQEHLDLVVIGRRPAVIGNLEAADLVEISKSQSLVAVEAQPGAQIDLPVEAVAAFRLPLGL